MGVMARLAYARAKASGLDSGKLLRRARLSRDRLEDPDLRLNVQEQIDFTTLVADLVGDEYLGLHLAELPDLRELGLLYYVIASSDVLIDAFHRVARYSSIVNEGISPTCLSGRTVKLSLRHVGIARHIDRHQIEFWMAIFLRMCRHITGLRLVPERVRLMHIRKPHGEFSKLFGDNIEFGANVDELEFSERTRRLPIRNSDTFLNRLLLRYCEDAISKREGRPGSFQTKVEIAIVPLLPHGEATASKISRHLGVSERTFTRRLSQEGLTFPRVLQRLRFDLASRYLADDNLSVSQAAWLLGFRDLSSFSHAFKRWTGKTPRQVRLGARQ